MRFHFHKLRLTLRCFVVAEMHLALALTAKTSHSTLHFAEYWSLTVMFCQSTTVCQSKDNFYFYFLCLLLALRLLPVASLRNKHNIQAEIIFQSFLGTRHCNSVIANLLLICTNRNRRHGTTLILIRTAFWPTYKFKLYSLLSTGSERDRGGIFTFLSSCRY